MNARRMCILKDILERGIIKVDLKTGTVVNTETNGILGHNCRGYLQASIRMDGQQYSFKIHDIVAFAGGLDVLDVTVNHKDGNKRHNWLDNLEAITHRENVVHAFRTGLRKTKLNPDEVEDIRRKYKSNKYSQQALASEYGVHQSAISRIVRGLRYTEETTRRR
jgi:hypothetical protein